MMTSSSASKPSDYKADESVESASLKIGGSSPRDVIVGPLPAAWDKARNRMMIIQPLLAEPGNRELLKEVSQQYGVSEATLYRWLRRYKTENSQASLVDKARGVKKGRVRVAEAAEAIIQEVIQTQYLTLQKKSPTHVLREINRLCWAANIKPPSAGSVYRRLHSITSEEKMRRREGAYAARTRYEPHKGVFPGADFPLAVVQMDHATVDIELVDERFRRPVGRPHLTLAIDVYSRMVIGFYLSLDEPGAAAVGLCLVHAILPKEAELKHREIAGEWPCHGLMQSLHTDNAREFKGSMLERACEEYQILLEHRPPREPHMGGHVERAIKTLLHETHALPGTTLSNPKQRGRYQSEAHAALTLEEFEKWLTIFLVQIYHCRLHEGIGTAPLTRYRQGLAELSKTKQPVVPTNELQLRLDFMPSVERTIQEYGVVIGHIHYYDDVLRPYINSCVSGSDRIKRKFLFKIDPRNISCIYFLDPDRAEYYRIPFRDRSQTPMSAREYVEVRKRLRQAEQSTIDEAGIFAAFNTMRAIEEAGIATTKSTRRLTKRQRRLGQGPPVLTTDRFFAKTTQEPEATPPFVPPITSLAIDSSTILPFDDLDDGTSEFLRCTGP
jgi:putative transposase